MKTAVPPFNSSMGKIWEVYVAETRNLTQRNLMDRF